MKCDSCEATIPEDSKFCPQCGFPIPQSKACNFCGATNGVDGYFCNQCGKPMQGDSGTQSSGTRSDHTTSVIAAHSYLDAGSIISQYRDQLPSLGKHFYFTFIPGNAANEKLSNFVNKYSKVHSQKYDPETEPALLYYDGTLFGSGKTGITFTETGIRAVGMLGDGVKSVSISYNQIVSLNLVSQEKELHIRSSGHLKALILKFTYPEIADLVVLTEMLNALKALRPDLSVDVTEESVDESGGLFKLHKGSRLQDQLEQIAHEWISKGISEYYSIDHPSELDSMSIAEIVSWYRENCASGGMYETDWYIEVGFRTLLNDWFSENNEALMDDAWIDDQSLSPASNSKFEFYKAGKLQNQLESVANEFITEAILNFYGAQDIESLTPDSIADLMSWYKSHCETGCYEDDWYIEVSFRTAINEWHEAHGQDEPL